MTSTLPMRTAYDNSLPATFHDLLEQRATERGDDIAVTFLPEELAVSYADLHSRARVVAEHLAAVTRPGDRALLLYPPGVDYIVALFACMRAGVIAVPAYPPMDGQHLPRLVAITRDCSASVVLTLSAIAAGAEAALAAAGAPAAVWLGTDGLGDAGAGAARGCDVALLQYTSGSTGDPKGVVLTHANLLANSAAIRRRFGHDESSVGVIWLPPYHDMGLIGGILQPIYAGFPVYLMSPLHFLTDPSRWLIAVSQFRGTTSGGPNFAYDLCARKVTDEQIAGLDLSSWRVAFCGAEPVRAASMRRFVDRFGGCGLPRDAIYPCYGLAEATLLVAGPTAGRPMKEIEVSASALGAGRVQPTAGPAEPVRRLVGCGPAAPGMSVRVVDAAGAEVPAGRIGEILVSGPSVSGRYWGRPVDEPFVAGPFGSGIRTGDLGFLHDGDLFVTGRAKAVIVVRGRNIHAEDVEDAVSGAHSDIRPGCVAAFDGADGEGATGALAVVAELRRGAATADPAAVADAAQNALVTALGVRADILVLARPGAVAKTSSGKVRRGETRERWLAGEVGDVRPAVPQRGGAVPAEALLSVVAGVLGTSPASLDASRSLAAQGVDSLRAVQIRHAAWEQLDLDVPLEQMLGDVSVRDLALAATPVVAVDSQSDVAEAASGEEDLWLACRSSTDPATYALMLCLELSRPIPPAQLEEALRQLVRRHPALRSAFRRQIDGRLLRVEVDLPAPLLPIVSTVDAGTPDATDDLRRRGFDVTDGPLWRAALVVEDCGRQSLAVCLSHLICDLWSLDLLASELGEICSPGGLDRAATWPAAGEPGRVHSRTRAALAGSRGEQLERFWRSQLDQRPPAASLPGAQLATGAGVASAMRVPLDGALAAAVRSAAGDLSVTPIAFVAGALGVVLHRYDGLGTFTLGIPAPGRLDPESASAVGYFVNPLPVVCTVDPDAAFGPQARAVRDRIAEAMAHQDLPTRDIGRLAGTTAADPLFRIMVSHHQGGHGWSRGGAPDPDGPFTMASAVQHNAPYDLTLELCDTSAGGLELFAQYDPAAVDSRQLTASLGHLVQALRSLATDPQALPRDIDLVDEAERRQVTVGWNPPGSAVPGPGTLGAAVLKAAEHNPTALAAQDGAGTLTYRQLVSRAGDLAARLTSAGVGAEAPVGLLMGRSRELLVGLLAAVCAGGAALPLDPWQPAARLAAIAGDAGPGAVLTTADLMRSADLPVGPAYLPVQLVGAPVTEPGIPDLAEHPLSLAYLLYTSGSTGTPKGVGCTHAGLLNLIAEFDRLAPLSPADRCAWWTSPGFDVTMYEVFSALVAGAAVVVCPTEIQNDADSFATWVADERITSAYVAPHLLPGLAEWASANPGRIQLRRLLVGVEPISEPLLREIAGLVPGLVVINGYGPTEATVCCTLHPVEAAGTRTGATPIGRGIHNGPVYLLDEQMRLAPVGAVGEVYAAGAGVARGYPGRPAATAERFVPDPFAIGGRLYRTGDLARWRPEGVLQFVGRVDDQVKVSGMRIEPREIEAALLGHPAVRAALVVAVPREGKVALTAYAQVGPGTDNHPQLAVELRHRVRRLLPAPMVPAHVVCLTEWPVTVNGKIDRSRLPEPSAVELAGEPPHGRVESAVAIAWSRVLGLTDVRRSDDFFDSGGDSLAAARVAAEVGRALAIKVSPADVLRHPTVAGLAACLPAPTEAPVPASSPARAALIARLCALSDTELERLLAEENVS